MKKSFINKLVKGIIGLLAILAMVLCGFVLTGNISHAQIVRAMSDVPYTIKSTVSKIRDGAPHTSEYISATPIFELGYETILKLKTDSQPLQVEALEITFEEPQIIESSDLVDEGSNETELSDENISATSEGLQSDMYASETTIESEQLITQISSDSEMVQTISGSTTPATTSSSDSVIGDASAKEWIAQKESGGSYSAQNGIYIGRYQLHSAYLNGDHSPENQERVADAYVLQRYGSWSAAYQFWLANGWY